MKNRLLPFSLLVLTLGFAAIFMSAMIAEENKSNSSNTADAYLNKLRSNQLTGAIDPAAVFQARNQTLLNENLNGSRALNLDWNIRGPNNLGGRTRALLIDNQDASGNSVYVGNVLGGMFKSDDGGLSWQKINQDNSNLHVTCLTQTSDGTLFAGTGEGFTMEEYNVLGDWGYEGGFLGQGMFKSSDGNSFNLIGSTQPTDTTWGFINELATGSGDMIFAATNAGLLYSSDKGATWATAMADTIELNANSKEVVTGPDGSVIAEVDNLCYVSTSGNPGEFVLRSNDTIIDLPNEDVGRIEFAIAPSDPNIFYALVVNADGALLNVYRSDNKGEEWYVVGPGDSENFNIFSNDAAETDEGQGLYSCEIEVFPNNADRVIIGGLDLWEGTKFGEGFFDWVLRSDGNQVPWVLPFYLPQGHHKYVFQTGNPTSCFIATNGGVSLGAFDPDFASFQVINKDYIGSQFYTVGLSNNDKILLGGAQDLGTIMMDGTLSVSEEKRGSDIWTTQADFPNGIHGGYCDFSVIYPEAVYYSKWHADPDPNNFVRRNEFRGGPDWSDNFFDDQTGYTSSAFIAPTLLWESFEMYNSGDTVSYTATYDVDANRTIWPESINKRPFQYIITEPLANGDSIRVVDPVAARYFIGGEDIVIMTRHAVQYDRAPEWMRISASDRDGVEGNVQCMAFTSDANHLFVGTLEGAVYRISNLAYAYDEESGDVYSQFCVVSTQKLPVYLPESTTEISQVITSIAVDPNNNNNVIITLGNYGNEHYVFMTTNALATEPSWSSIQGNPDNGGLPLMPAYASLFEMDPDNNLVFIGTEYGIFTSENVGAQSPTWTAQNMNIGKVPVFMLRQQLIRKKDDVVKMVVGSDTTYMTYPGNNNYGVIYGATFGRGLIALYDFQKPVGINEIISGSAAEAQFSLHPNPATDMVNLTYDLKDASPVSYQIYDISGRMLVMQKIGKQDVGHYEIPVSCQDLPAGSYVFRLSVGDQISSSKFIVY